MKIKGKSWKFNDNINTEDIDKEFPRKISSGDVIVAGRNFGCGSSREHAPIAIKGCGISCVIAESFARIFYRNAINIGLPIFVSEEAAKDIKENDEVEIDTEAGKIVNLTRGKTYQTDKFADFMQEIVDNGGLLNWIEKKGLVKK